MTDLKPWENCPPCPVVENAEASTPSRVEARAGVRALIEKLQEERKSILEDMERLQDRLEDVIEKIESLALLLHADE